MTRSKDVRAPTGEWFLVRLVRPYVWLEGQFPTPRANVLDLTLYAMAAAWRRLAYLARRRRDWSVRVQISSFSAERQGGFGYGEVLHDEMLPTREAAIRRAEAICVAISTGTKWWQLPEPDQAPTN